MKIIKVTLSVCILLSVLLTSCTQSTPVQQESQDISDAEIPQVATETAPPKETGSKKVFRYAFGTDYGGARLDPNITFNVLAANLFAGLTILNHEGMIVEGEGAAKSWDISPDGTVYTFHLYDDMKWSDGHPLTAHDFEFSWKRALDPATKSIRAFMIYLVKGAEEFNTGTGNKDDVGVRALDDFTLEVTLTRPAPFFPDFIAVQNVYYAVPKHLIEEVGDKWTETDKIVFSGPFMVTEYSPDLLIIMEPNPGYTRVTPNVDRVEYYVIPEASTALAKYQAGEIDFMMGIPLGETENIRNDPVLKDEFTSFSESRIMALDFNVTKPPFDNLKVRQAIAAAVNQKALVDGPFRGVFPYVTSLRPPGVKASAFDSVSNLYNPERAKQLLAEAGYPDGQGFPETKIQARNQEDSRIAAEFIQSQISEVLNIPITVEILEYNAFIDLTEHGQGDMFVHAIFYRSPDLYDLFDTIRNTSRNYCQWKNPGWDALLDKAAVEPDNDTRMEMYNEAEMTIINEAVIIPLWVTDRPSLVKPYVKNLTDEKRGVWTFIWDVVDIQP